MFEAKFQSFDDETTAAASGPRVAALRTELERRGLAGFIVPRADRHQNEYVPASEERLAWLTGFTGSAGAAIVLMERAALFVDGRYTLQAREQVDTSLFAIEHLVETPPDQWLEQNLGSGDRSATTRGCTPSRAPSGSARPAPRPARRWSRSSPIRSTRSGPIGRRRRSAPVVLHDLRFAGEEAATKLSRIRPEIGKLKADALVVSDPHAVAWTFNIRGSDVAHTPLPLAFAIIPREGRPALYVDGRKLSNEVRHALEALADVREPAAFARDLAALGRRARRCGSIRRPPPMRSRASSNEAGGKVTRGPDPIALMKAVKNSVEIAGARAAHLRDGAAVARFLAWFDREAPEGHAHRDRGGRGAGKLSAARPACSRTSRSPPSPAPARTAPSCTTG